MLISLMITSCDHQEYPRELVDADRLADESPDTAMVVLSQMESKMRDASERDWQYYNLLKIKASDKADCLQCTPDDILEIIDYYTSDGDKELLPMALYYAGRVYRTHNNATEARYYFLQAIEQIDNIGEERYARLKSKCYSQLGSIYLYQSLYNEAIEMYSKAYYLNYDSRDSVGMIFNLRDIANSYLSVANPDSCLEYCKRGITLAEAIGDSLFLNELYLLSAGAHISGDHYTLARDDFDKALRYAPEWQSVAQITIGARLCYATDSIDLCRDYAVALLDRGDIYSKRWASRVLAEIAVRHGQPEQAIRYLGQYRLYDDSAANMNRAETILKMNALYDYSLKVQENSKLREEKHRQGMILGVIVGLLLIVICFAAFYIRAKRQQHALMKLRIEKLETLKRENKSKAPETRKHEEEIIENSEIYRHIKRLSNSPGASGVLSAEEWLQVGDVVEEAFPRFRERLLDLCKMNENEMRVCLLLKMNFTPSVIAQLTFHSKESVSATRRRLFTKAFGQQRAPKDWDEFIRTL